MEVDYEKLYEILEEMRRIEKFPCQASLYHSLLYNLPKSFSTEDLINYHNFSIKLKEKEIKELEEENKELSDEEKDELIKDYKLKLLDKLKTRCSLDDFSEIEQIVERL